MGLVNERERQLAVYNAEDQLDFFIEHGGLVEVYGSTIYVEPCERKFAREEDAQAYVNLVFDWLEMGDPPRVKVDRRMTKSARYIRSNNTIRVGDHVPGGFSWGLREVVLLHEMAHAITPGGHDTTFCNALVHLVSRCMSPEIGLLLTKLYRENGVQI